MPLVVPEFSRNEDRVYARNVYREWTELSIYSVIRGTKGTRCGKNLKVKCERGRVCQSKKRGKDPNTSSREEVTKILVVET